MIKPLPREQVLDLTSEPLGGGWLRRGPTGAEAQETPAPGVWRTGPQLRFRDELVAGLDAATDVALVSSFLLAEEKLAAAMLRAAERNVRVYVLTASEQRIGKVVREDEAFEQRMADQHKKLLDSLAGKVRLRSAEHIHAKFLVVDPQKETRVRAWLSTANFNKALEDSVELGVALDPAGARALATCFQWAFWQEAERELRGPGRLMKIEVPPALPARPNDTSVHATLKDATALRERVVSMIQGARQEILVASYGLGADHPAVRALAEAARKGRSVTVLTRPRRAVAAGVAALASAGATIVAHDKLHAKALFVDGKALVMSANLEAHGLDQGFEVGALLPPEIARGVERTLREWASTFPWIHRASATRGEHLGDFCPADAVPRDGTLRVTEWHAQSAPDVVAADALRLDDAPAPAVKPAPPQGTLPQRVKVTWDVRPPALPKGATERLREVEREEAGKDGKPRKVKARVPYEPPVFEHAGKLHVVVRKDEDIDGARQLAAELRGSVVVSR